jgi:hypothetical protein
MRHHHEPAHLVTAELVELYKRRARRLHAEACRQMWLMVWSSLRGKR